jgi:hypothetical protein
VRIAADGFAKSFLDCGSERFGESAVAAVIEALLDGFDDHRADVVGAALEIVHAIADVGDSFLLGRDDQMAEFFEFAAVCG